VQQLKAEAKDYYVPDFNGGSDDEKDGEVQPSTFASTHFNVP
jgi:hypothetical protein